jgi:hypothetical protein
MSFQWNVQPYAWKKDLVNEYAGAVFYASRARAKKYAVEAQAWMKQNAPWNDRSAKVRARLVKRGVLAASNVPARIGLHVTVDDSEEKAYNKGRAELTSDAIAQAESDYKRAVRQAENDYRQANTVGYEQTLERLLPKVESGMFTIEEARIIAERRSTTSTVIVPQSVTKGVKKSKPNFTGRNDFDKEYRSQRMPVVSLTFGYGKNVPYAVFLEIANGGRYAIIGPATERYADKFFNDVRRIANLKQFRDRIIFGEQTTPEQRFEEYTAAGGESWTSSRKEARAKRRPESDVAFERNLEDYEMTPIGHHRARRASARRKGR